MAETKLIRDHHLLTRNLVMNDKYLSNDGQDEGVSVDDLGLVTVSNRLQIASNMTIADNDIEVTSGDFLFESSGLFSLSSNHDDSGGVGSAVFYFQDGRNADLTYAKLYTTVGLGFGETSNFRLFEAGGPNLVDYFNIATGQHGSTTLSTFSQSEGGSAHLIFQASGGIQFLSFAGRDIIFKPGAVGDTEEASVIIDYDAKETEDSTNIALVIDYDHNTVMADGETAADVGLHIDMDDTADTNHSGSTVTMTGIDVDLNFTSDVGTTKNIGLDVVVAGADTNYAATLMGGNVGIGVADPDSVLEVMSTGNILKLSRDVDDYLLFTQQNNGDSILESTGGVQIKVDTSTDFSIYEDVHQRFLLENSGSHTKMAINSAANASDKFAIEVQTEGATVISTTDNDTDVAHLSLDINGDITLNSFTGRFIAEKNGAEFSVANSAYAGMILGITVEGINQTPATYALTTSNALVASATHHVSFKAPPSEVVEIEVQINYDSGSSAQVLRLGLSDHTLILSNSLPTYLVQQIYESSRAINDMNVIHKWIVSGLTAGDTYKWYLTASVNSTSGSPTLQWGGDSINENPVFTMKATALPTAVSDFAIYS